MAQFRKTGFLTAGIVLALGAAGAFAFVRMGLYDVAADVPHSGPVHALLDSVREASIARRARTIQVPADLDSPARITQGAGNYNAMCMGCHLAPGMDSTELSRGLYPAPPDLTQGMVDAAEAFWVVKHGIKASGMPAWGHSMGDEYIWNMVAFIRAMPKMSEAQYADAVARSGGHSHGGGETPPHDHGAAAAAGDPHTGHHGASAGSDHHAPAPAKGDIHVHADGRTHVHDAPSKPAIERRVEPARPGDVHTHDPHQQ